MNHTSILPRHYALQALLKRKDLPKALGGAVVLVNPLQQPLPPEDCLRVGIIAMKN